MQPDWKTTVQIMKQSCFGSSRSFAFPNLKDWYIIKCVKQVKFSYIAGRYMKWYNSLDISYIVNIYLPCDSSNLLLGICSREMKMCSY